VSIGGQQHFYMETYAAVAVPSAEYGAMEVHLGSQDPFTGQVWNIV